jgi:ketosteroid isomerase-like protein
MSDHANITTINAMTTAIFEQDHDALTKIFTDEVGIHLRGPHPMAGDHVGLGSLLDALGWMFEVTAGKIDLDQKLCVATDGWASEFEYATLGRAADDDTVVSQNSFVYRFDGGRIAEMWVYLGLDANEAEKFFS